MKKTFPSPKTTTVDQSQVRDVNSRQPSRSSWKKFAAGTSCSARGGIRIRASSSAAATNDTASTASAMPGLPAATITPPTAGPSDEDRFRTRPFSAFACWRRAALTVCGTSPVCAGMTNPSAAP